MPIICCVSAKYFRSAFICVHPRLKTNLQTYPDLPWSHRPFRHHRRIDELGSKAEHRLIQDIIELHRWSQDHPFKVNLARHIQIEHESSRSSTRVPWQISNLPDLRDSEPFVHR